MMTEDTSEGWKDNLSLEDQLRSWVEFYGEQFGIELDTSSLKIPKKPDYPVRLLVLAEGLSIKKISDSCFKGVDGEGSLAGEQNDLVEENQEARTLNVEEPITYAIWVTKDPEKCEDVDALLERHAPIVSMLYHLKYGDA